MKKYMLSISIALIIGFLCGKFFLEQYDAYEGIKFSSNEGEMLYFIRYGIYNSEAEMEKNTLSLVNYVYNFDITIPSKTINTIIENIGDASDKCKMFEPRTKWKELNMFNRWSNKYLANSFETKLRSLGGYTTSNVNIIHNVISAKMEENKDVMAECEHNRWNVQQLLMGFRAYKDDELEEFESLRKKSASSNEAKVAFKEFKNKMKNSPEKVHLNICSISMLHKLDKDAEVYDEVFNASIPAILQCIEKHNKEIS